MAAKKLYRRLEALGASPLLPLVLGDDQAAGGYEAGVDPALCTLWESLGAAFPLPLSATEVRSPIGLTGRAAAQAAASWPPGSALEAAAAARRGVALAALQSQPDPRPRALSQACCAAAAAGV